MSFSIISCVLCGDLQKSMVCYWCRQFVRFCHSWFDTVEEEQAYLRATRENRFNPIAQYNGGFQ